MSKDERGNTFPQRRPATGLNILGCRGDQGTWLADFGATILLW